MRQTAGQMLRGLRALEGAGLVRFVKQGRGRCPVVEIVDRPSREAGQT
jgi:predicted transcriptional regulator